MASIRQRYQKIRNLSAVATGFRYRGGMWLLGMLGLVAGCAGAASGNAPTDAVISPPPTAVPDVRASLLSLTPRQVKLPVVPPAARQAVVDAHDALEKKQWKALQALVTQAQPDPILGAYPQYWWLRQQLHDSTQPIPQGQLEQFLATTDNLYLADRLKGDWVVAAVRAGDYKGALGRVPVNASAPSVSCSLVLARHMTGTTVSADDAMSVFSPNRACWGMLDQLVSDNVVGWDAWSFKLRAILETSATGSARRLAAVMFDGAQMVQYTALMKDPKKWLSRQPAPTSQADTELVTIALSRLARSDNRADVAAYIDQHWADAIPPKNLEWVWSQFGLVAALRVEPDAARWYRRSGDGRLTDYNHAWAVRAELREPSIDWARVQAGVDRMTQRQASEPVWVYWRARALDAQGHTRQATQQYTLIASDLSFYGQLANEELGHEPFVPAMPKPVTQAEFDQAQDNMALQRAIQLFDLGWRPQAVGEWNFALRGMSDRALLAVAELARHEQIYDRVVNTSLLTRDDIDFSQRFVAPFEGRVTEKAREINLDPAWVYGLIRQESRFMTDARSRVGASGLMQLMPATASWVAKKIGMTDFRPGSVNDFDTNTVLGTNYLRMVLDRLDGHEILATAGYNAGPGRPIRWRSRLAGPVEGAIFAETIPFTETRLYVKNVMSNATYYAMVFSGKPHSLKDRLGTVVPKPDTKAGLP